MTAVLAIAIFVGAYVLLATEKVHRTKVALVGAGLMLLLGITDAEHAFFDEETAVDWNVIFLLLGMMVIVSVLRQTGIFEYIAILAAKRSTRPSLPADGVAVRADRRRVRGARQRHHGSAHRTADVPGLRAARPHAGPSPMAEA